MLSFFGRGSAFSDKHNSAYFVDGKTLVLIDCSMTSFLEVKNAPLDNIEDIVILVTHTHSDHVSGIAMLIDYSVFVSHKKVTVVAPSTEVKKDLLYYFRNIDGCADEWYQLTTVDEVSYSWLVEAIPTKHTPLLEGKCFGYELLINGIKVIYSGDSNTLEPFKPRLNPGSQFYCEVSSNKSGVHIFVDDALPYWAELTKNGVEVYLMHLDDEVRISDKIKGTGIELAPIKSLEVTMNNSDAILNEIFDISNKLYENISKNLDDNHNDIFMTLTELGKTLGQCDRASFWKWDKRNSQLWTTSATGVDKIVIPDNSGLVGKAISSKKVVITNDPYNDPDFNSTVDKATGYVTKSILVLPVADVNGNFLGAYQLINKNDDEGFTDDDVRKLSLGALVCGLALESEVYLDDSHRDRLTKLKNRMGFYYDFSHKYAQYLEDKESTISMFICDIDKFKRVNDTYGHNAGDDVLAFVANLIENACDETQSVYRWGGEEFIMIMPEMTLQDAVNKAEEIRKIIMNSTINADGNEINCTMSFGCRQFDMTKTIEENISVADGHLYTAKESGRNCVIS